VTRLSEIEGHMASMGGLLDVVGAMRSLASMRMQEAQAALPGARRYAEMMASAIGKALLLVPERPAGRGRPRSRQAVILCLAEHGFVGGFNARLLEAAGPGLGEGDLLMVLGSRGAALLQERGRVPDWLEPLPTRLTGVTETVTRLATELFGRIARRGIGRAEVMFPRLQPGGATALERRTLLPVDLAALAAPGAPPLHNLRPDDLLERLAEGYVYARLAEAVIESLASENAARFAAMASARENVAKKLEELRRQAQQARQEEITTELLDLVAGADASNGRRESPGG
jgi:F-type H+-transporting ATPase subunit gamma